MLVDISVSFHSASHVIDYVESSISYGGVCVGLESMGGGSKQLP